jgi:hypothetical protein
VLPEDELKSAFINMSLPEWQQEFLMVDINEHASTWEETISKAEALETAELALAERRRKEMSKKERQLLQRASSLLKRRPRRKRRLPSVANYMALDRVTTPLDAKSSMAKSIN